MSMKKVGRPAQAAVKCSIEPVRDLTYSVVQMSSLAPLGEFEQVVLLAILRLDDNAYGVTIRAEIAACTHREPSPGAIYITLDRLEEKRLVTSRFGEPTPQRGGRSKRYFTVTAAGVEAVTRAQSAYQRLLKGLKLSEVFDA